MRSIGRITALVAAVSFLAPGPARGAGPTVSIVQQWDIVVAGDAIPSERYAAEEFQRFFAQATGTQLPIRHTAEGTGGHILIGPGAVAQGGPLGFVTSDFGPEDLRVVVRETGIAIAGGRPRGTLYGVYTFLEDTLGIRFLTHEHNHVPSLADATQLALVDRTYRPPLRFRWSYFGEIAEDHAFATRMRTNTVQDEAQLGFVI